VLDLLHNSTGVLVYVVCRKGGYLRGLVQYWSPH